MHFIEGKLQRWELHCILYLGVVLCAVWMEIVILLYCYCASVLYGLRIASNFISVLCCVLYGRQHGSSEGNQGLCYSFLGRVASAITRLVGLYKAPPLSRDAQSSFQSWPRNVLHYQRPPATPLETDANLESNTSGVPNCQIAATETLKSGADLKKATLPLNGSNTSKQQASCFLKLETTPLWIQMPVQCYQRQQNLWMLILPTKKRTTLLLLSKTALLWTGFHDPKINQIYKYKMDKNSK